MLKKLPHWILPTTSPAFDDKESGTAIEMVGRIYKKMNELIDNYNQFVETVNNSNTAFQEGMEQKFEVFTIGLRQEFQDFIDTVDLAFDNYCVETLEYLETNLDERIAKSQVITNLTTKLTNDELKIKYIETLLDTMQSELDSFSGVMWVTYGTTTLDEVTTAFSEGKYIICRKTTLPSNTRYQITLPLTGMYLGTDSRKFEFSGVVAGKNVVATLSNTGWTISENDIVTTTYVGNAINTAITGAMGDSY